METQSHYGIFLRNLEAFKAFLESSPQDSQEIVEKFTNLEQTYREKILVLTEGESDRANSNNIFGNSSLWQSLHTETHRTIRLLQTDIIFLQASRQAKTRQQRQAACLVKIERLIGYCQKILTEEHKQE
jgi:hypothetical protein